MVVDNLEPEDLPEVMVIGTIFHNDVEKLYDLIDKEKILSGQVSLSDEYSKFLGTEIHYLNFIKLEQTRFDNLGGVGKVTMDFFPFHRELYMEDRELMFYGTLDRIDKVGDDFVVIDYKVSDKPKHDSAYSKYRLELAGYAHLAEVNKIVPGKVKYIGIMFARSGDMFFEELKEASRKAFFRNLEKVKEGIKNRQFDANPGWGCQYCPYEGKCKMDEGQVT
jgi:CRISPR/Cas system-associated exonuclease Cas4 (RecB family)